MRVEEVLEYFDTKQHIARAIGISESAVYQWGELVPMSRRQSVRMAMKERADELELEAKRLRARAAE